MKTEKVNLLEQEMQLPCTRVVNGFRLYPFFTKTKKLAWFIKPNNSEYVFAFGFVEAAECFACKFSNNHSEVFWFRHFERMYNPIFVCSSLDGLSSDITFFDADYCCFVCDAIALSLYGSICYSYL